MNLEKFVLNKVQKNKKYQRLLKDLDLAIKSGNFLIQSKIQGDMNKIKEEITNELMRELSSDKTSLMELSKKMKPGEFSKCILYSNAINYMVDWIDIMVVSMNTIIERIYPNGSIPAWDKIRALGKEVQLHLDNINNSSEKIANQIAENSDELFEIVIDEIKNKLLKKYTIGDKVRLKGRDIIYEIVGVDRRRKEPYLIKQIDTDNTPVRVSPQKIVSYVE